MNISHVVDNESRDLPEKEMGCQYRLFNSFIDMLRNGIDSDSCIILLFRAWNTCYVKNQVGKFTVPQALIKKPIVVVTEKLIGS